MESQQRAGREPVENVALRQGSLTALSLSLSLSLPLSPSLSLCSLSLSPPLSLSLSHRPVERLRHPEREGDAERGQPWEGRVRARVLQHGAQRREGDDGGAGELETHRQPAVGRH